MPDPSPEEIRFAQQRRPLIDRLSPYFYNLLPQEKFPEMEGGGNIQAADGGRPRENTIRGQTIDFGVRVRNKAGAAHWMQLVIGHDEQWQPVAVISSDASGPREEAMLTGSVESIIEQGEKLLQDTIARMAGES